MIDRKFFFDKCRQTLFAGRMSKTQVEGIDFIISAWEKSYSHKDIRWLAYALATAYHETAFTMQPIKEYGSSSYFYRMYDPQSPVPSRARLSKESGALPGDGIIFYGRGYVQLTWRTNYDKMGKIFKIDLTSSAAAADRALEPELASLIMFKGMEEGIFTGKRLSHYFNGSTEDWKNARRIINGLDRAEDIAVYAKNFGVALKYPM